MRTETDLYVIEKVKEIRIKQGFTQEALSFALNKTRNFINVREAGPKKYLKFLNVAQGIFCLKNLSNIAGYFILILIVKLKDICSHI